MRAGSNASVLLTIDGPWWLAAGLVVAFGLLLRTLYLGEIGFWWDELYHVSAARALIENGDTYIPLIGPYDRSPLTTALVEWMFARFGESELTARLPFALIGTVLIVATYAVTASLLGRGAALMAAIFVAFCPLTIELAREARMYAPFELFYLLASAAFIYGLEARDGRLRKLTAFERRLEINLLWLGASAVLLLLALVFHDLALTFGIVGVTYAIAALVIDVWQNRGLRVAALKYVGIIALAGLAVAFAFWHDAEGVRRLADLSGGAPAHWPAFRSSPSYYRYFLSENYPAFFFVYPLAALVVIKRFGKVGLFLVLSFSLLIVLHALAFPRKWHRYIVYITPFFAMVSGYLLWEIVRAGWAYVARTFHGSRRLAWPMVALAALLAFNVIGNPFVAAARYVPTTKRYPTFKNFPENLKAALLQEDATVITTRIMAYRYYLGASPDYGIGPPGEYRGGEDNRFGIVALSGVEQLRLAMESAPGTLFVLATPTTFFQPNVIDDEMRELIEHEMTRVETANYPDAILYRRDPQPSLSSTYSN